MLFSRINNDINSGVELFRQTPAAILLDVRTEEEYQEGHIPDSINLPLQMIGQADQVIQKKELPIFVYCRSGARSDQAVRFLKEAGYTDVQNIGGILKYRGEIV